MIADARRTAPCRPHAGEAAAGRIGTPIRIPRAHVREPTSVNRPSAGLARLLVRFGAMHRAAVRAEWAAAQAAGLPLIVVDDGTLLLGAAPAMTSTMFNRGLGLTERPDLLGTALAFFAEHGVQGDVALDPADAATAGSSPAFGSMSTSAAPGDTSRRRSTGSTIRTVDGATTTASRPGCASSSKPTRRPPRWPTCGGGWRRSWLGRPAGRTWSGRWTARSWPRGRCSRRTASAGRAGRRSCPRRAVAGIQRALIDARSRLAAERGCDLVAAWALAGAHSSANLERAGLARIGQRVIVRAADLG